MCSLVLRYISGAYMSSFIVFIAEYCFVLWIYSTIFIHSPVLEHLDYFIWDYLQKIVL